MSFAGGSFRCLRALRLIIYSCKFLTEITFSWIEWHTQTDLTVTVIEDEESDENKVNEYKTDMKAWIKSREFPCHDFTPTPRHVSLYNLVRMI